MKVCCQFPGGKLRDVVSSGHLARRVLPPTCYLVVAALAQVWRTSTCQSGTISAGEHNISDGLL